MNDVKVDKHIEFKESTHTYRNINSDERYTSVTTLIGKYFKKFKATMQKSASTRKKYNMSHEEVLALWDKKRQDSCDRGSEIHYMLEVLFNHKEYCWDDNIFVDPNEMKAYHKIGKKKYNELKHLELIPEALLWDDNAKIAGQADLPILNHEKKTILLIDHKTNNKELSYTNPFEPTMLPPFNSNPSGDLVKYGIQLAIYSILLEQKYEGYTTELLEVWHFRNSKMIPIKLNLKFFRGIAKEILRLRYEEIRNQCS